jgi:hypothetical protein
MTLGKASSLELRGSVIRTGLTVIPIGTLPYQLAHYVIGGNYFDHQDLNGQRIESGAMLTRTVSESHLFRAGVTVGRAIVDGIDVSAPVDLLHSDGTLSRQITFLPGELIAASTYEVGVYAHDTWPASPCFTVDARLCYDRTTAAQAPTVSPRLGWTIKAPNHGASLSGTVGLFADKLVPAALAVVVIRELDELHRPRALCDRLLRVEARDLERARHAGRARADGTFSSIASSRTAGWFARAYQERHGREAGYHSIRCGRARRHPGPRNSGRSDARSGEATVGYRAPACSARVTVACPRAAF